MVVVGKSKSQARSPCGAPLDLVQHDEFQLLPYARTLCSITPAFCEQSLGERCVVVLLCLSIVLEDRMNVPNQLLEVYQGPCSIDSSLRSAYIHSQRTSSMTNYCCHLTPRPVSSLSLVQLYPHSYYSFRHGVCFGPASRLDLQHGQYHLQASFILPLHTIKTVACFPSYFMLWLAVFLDASTNTTQHDTKTPSIASFHCGHNCFNWGLNSATPFASPSKFYLYTNPSSTVHLPHH